MTRKLRMQNPLSLSVILVILVGVLALAYAAFAATPFVRGPALSVAVETAEGAQMHISGSAERVSSLWLNDLPIPISDQGTFSVIRTYPPGYTEIVVRAEDRFGRFRTARHTFVNTHFIDYASEENDEESSQEDSENGSSSSTEGDEGGEARSN